MGPDGVFFNKRQNVELAQSGKSDDVLNGNKYFPYIKNLRAVDDELCWGIYVANDVPLAKLHCEMEIFVNCDFEQKLQIGTQTVILKPVKDSELYTWTCDIINLPKGFHEVTLSLSKIIKQQGRKGVGTIKYLKLVLPGKAYLVRERWRPDAAHFGFSSSKIKRIDAWVMALTKEPESLGCYNPINAQFGYYGSTSGGSGDFGIPNLSMWSFGRNDTPPPIYHQSRLLAIGDPNAQFGYFYHEGTGVKIRGFRKSMWDSNESGEHVFALKYQKEPKPATGGNVFRYTAYYWDEGEDSWRLYGCGQDYVPQNIKSLKISGFIEIAGGPTRQRTGHRSRKLYYSGYCRSKNRKYWGKIDRLKPIIGSTKIDNQVYGVEGDKFFVENGGFKQYDMIPYRNKIPLDLSGESVEDDLPSYMLKIDQIEEHMQFPSVESATLDEETNQITMSLDIPQYVDHLGNQIHTHDVTIYAGHIDGLSIEKLWNQKYIVKGVATGKSSIKIPDLYKLGRDIDLDNDSDSESDSDDNNEDEFDENVTVKKSVTAETTTDKAIDNKKYYRIMVKNSVMQIFSLNTGQIEIETQIEI